MKKNESGIQISSKNKNVTNVTRRNFITSCSACAACLALKPVSFIDTPSAPGRRTSIMRIRIIYSLHAPVKAVPDWPNIGFDLRPEMEKINSSLSSRFRNIEVLPVLATDLKIP
jgi:hypothetical protein